MILYKYLSPERVDVLRKCHIRYTQPKAFNDPFEVSIYLEKLADDSRIDSTLEEVLPQELRRAYESYPGLRDVMSYIQFEKLVVTNFGGNLKELLRKVSRQMAPIFQETINEKFNQLLGILCLSETPDEELMWAHYATGHMGFIVGFDSTHSYFNEQKSISDELRHLRKVDYREKRPVLPMVELTGEEMFLVKSSKWAYEKEWRILRPLSEAMQFEDVHPYPIYLFSFPSGAIKSVILGCKIPDEVAKDIINILNMEHFRHVQIKQAILEKAEYQVSFKNIKG